MRLKFSKYDETEPFVMFGLLLCLPPGRRIRTFNQPIPESATQDSNSNNPQIEDL